MRSTYCEAIGQVTTRVDAFSCDQWNNVISSFDDALYDHTGVLAEALRGRSRLSRIVVFRNNVAIGAAQLNIFRPLPGVRAGLAYARYAPLWQRKDRRSDRADLRLILQAMIRAYVVERGLHLTILPQADPDHCATVVHELERLGFRYRRDVFDNKHYIIDVALNPEEQRISLHHKWRYNLKQSLRNGIRIEIASGPRAVDDLMRLNRALCTRKGIVDRSWVNLFPKLYPQIAPAMRPTIVMAYHAGTPTAGVVIGRLGKTASDMFGGTDERALSLRAGYALQWWVINWLHQAGVAWYDLDADAISPGLAQFKSGLVGKAGHILPLPGEYDYCGSNNSRVVAETIQLIRSIRNTMRVMVGRP